MYHNYWRLSHQPFESDADARFFYRSETHQAALLKLRYLIEHRKGAGLLLGDSGLGKSYLCRVLQDQLPEALGPCVHLVFPQMSPSELLAYLAVELGVAQDLVGPDVGLDRTVHEIQRQLASFAQQGRHPVIFIDEAHLIDDVQVFQALRLLLNFQDPQPLLSLVFVGEADLLSQFRRLSQLEERIAVKSLLRPLTEEETVSYVSWRLQEAGAERPLFEPAALSLLYEASAGNPRRINRLCDLALLVGFADELPRIGPDQIAAVAEELTAVAAD